MAEPVAAVTWGAVQVLPSMVGFALSVAANQVDPRQALRSLRARLRHEARPVNHDLLRAFRDAQLHAARMVVQDWKRRSRDDPDYHAATANAIAQGLRAERGRLIKKAEWTGWLTDPGLPEALDRVIGERDRGAPAGLRQVQEEAMATWLVWLCHEPRHVEAGHRRPGFDAFLAFLCDPERGNWFGLVHLCFVETVKTDDRVRTALFLDLFAETLDRIPSAADIEAAMAPHLAALGVQLDRIEQAQAEMRQAVLARIDGATDDVLDAVLGVQRRLDRWEALAGAQTDLADTLAAQVQALTAAADPRLTGKAARDQMALLMAALPPAVVGRQNLFDTLDARTEGAEPTLTLIAAPAGVGKSTALADWTRSRHRRGRFVAAFFFREVLPKGRSAVLTRINAALTHLVVELSAYHGRPVPPLREDRDLLLAHLTGLLTDPGRAAEPLVILLDGLDEAEATFPETTWAVREALPDHVHVIVAGRQNTPDSRFSSFRAWDELIDDVDDPADRDRFGARLTVEPLPDASAVETLILARGLARPDRMADDARAVLADSEGVPLFIDLILEEVEGAVAAGRPPAEAWAQALGPTDLDPGSRPEETPIGRYIDRRFQALREHPDITREDARLVALARLFHALAIAPGWLPRSHLVWLANIDADMLDHVLLSLGPVDRWIAQRSTKDGSLWFRFVHPRLRIALRAHFCLKGDGEKLDLLHNQLLSLNSTRSDGIEDRQTLSLLTHSVRPSRDSQTNLEETASEKGGNERFAEGLVKLLGTPDGMHTLKEALRKIEPVGTENQQLLRVIAERLETSESSVPKDAIRAR